MSFPQSNFESEKSFASIFFIIISAWTRFTKSARYFIECSFFTQQNYNALNHRIHRVWRERVKGGGRLKGISVQKSGVKNRLGKSCFGFVINSLSPIYLFYLLYGSKLSLSHFMFLLLWKVFILIYICYIIIPIIFLVKKLKSSSSSPRRRANS